MKKSREKIKREVDHGLGCKKPAEKEQPSQEALPALEPPTWTDNKETLKEEGSIDLRGQMTVKELKFLEVYLSGECSIDKSMIAAGFGNYHIRSRYRRARGIIKKYEEQAGSARKVLRGCGVGEVRVAKKIDTLMDAPSDRTQLGATELAARVLGMTQEQRGSIQGIQIIINTAPAAAPVHSQPGQPPVRAEVQEKKPLPPQSKPLQITT